MADTLRTGDGRALPQKSCWARLSPLNLALIMILIVAIPYFIGLLVVVVYYGVTNEHILRTTYITYVTAAPTIIPVTALTSKTARFIFRDAPHHRNEARMGRRFGADESYYNHYDYTEPLPIMRKRKPSMKRKYNWRKSMPEATTEFDYNFNQDYREYDKDTVNMISPEEPFHDISPATKPPYPPNIADNDVKNVPNMAEMLKPGANKDQGSSTTAEGTMEVTSPTDTSSIPPKARKKRSIEDTVNDMAEMLKPKHVLQDQKSSTSVGTSTKTIATKISSILPKAQQKMSSEDRVKQDTMLREKERNATASLPRTTTVPPTSTKKKLSWKSINHQYKRYVEINLTSSTDGKLDQQHNSSNETTMESILLTQFSSETPSILPNEVTVELPLDLLIQNSLMAESNRTSVKLVKPYVSKRISPEPDHVIELKLGRKRTFTGIDLKQPNLHLSWKDHAQKFIMDAPTTDNFADNLILNQSKTSGLMRTELKLKGFLKPRDEFNSSTISADNISDLVSSTTSKENDSKGPVLNIFSEIFNPLLARVKRQSCPVCPKFTVPKNCPSRRSGDPPDFPFIAALNEIRFVDAPSDDGFRFRCTGVLIDENFFLTSAECIDRDSRKINFYQIRAGSNYYNSDRASIHVVEKAYYKYDERDPEQLVLLQVRTQFPAIDSIQYVELSDKYINWKKNKRFVSYRWDALDILPLKSRTKRKKIKMETVTSEDCASCTGQNSICTVEKAPLCSNYFYESGIPLFYKNKLIGMQKSAYCDENTNTVERCFIGVVQYASWIGTMKKIFA